MRVYLVQGSKEWLEFRKTKIGSSDAPQIYGVSPWGNATKVYKEKTQGATPYVNDAMRHGTKREPKARIAYMNMTGVAIVPAVFASDHVPYMSASLDGFSESQGYGVEIKCPSKLENHAMAQRGIIPFHYQVQMAHQLLTVPELSHIHYFSDFEDEEPALITYELDADLAPKLLQAEELFWNSVVKLEEPETEDEVSDEDAEDLIYGHQLIYEANRSSKLADEWKKLAKDKYKAPLRAKGIRIGSSKSKGAVDKEMILSATGVDIDQYRKPDKETITIALYS